MFTEVMDRLEMEARALKGGGGSRMNWRILTVLYCIKVGNYGNLCPFLLDLSERHLRGEWYSRVLMAELRREFRTFLVGLMEENRTFFRAELERMSDRVESYGHWWWRELLAAVS